MKEYAETNILQLANNKVEYVAESFEKTALDFKNFLQDFYQQTEEQQKKEFVRQSLVQGLLEFTKTNKEKLLLKKHWGLFQETSTEKIDLFLAAYGISNERFYNESNTFIEKYKQNSFLIGVEIYDKIFIGIFPFQIQSWINSNNIQINILNDIGQSFKDTSDIKNNFYKDLSSQLTSFEDDAGYRYLPIHKHYIYMYYKKLSINNLFAVGWVDADSVLLSARSHTLYFTCLWLSCICFLNALTLIQRKKVQV